MNGKSLCIHADVVIDRTNICMSPKDKLLMKLSPRTTVVKNAKLGSRRQGFSGVSERDDTFYI